MLSESDIPWTPTPEPLSLRSETDIAATFLNLPEAEQIAWLAGLVLDVEQLRTTVHAYMDALSRSLEQQRQLEARCAALTDQLRQLLQAR